VLDFLAHRPPPYVGGILLGLLVVAVLWVLNERLGVSGGIGEIAHGRFGWRSWFVFGITGGALVFSLLSGTWRVGDGYGWLAAHGPVATGLALAGAGLLIGFGTRTAGGCTSGHGIAGTALGSLASFVSTATFVGTAIVTAFFLQWTVG
jgi:uncharacterized membrane protein YedE/YeeE